MSKKELQNALRAARVTILKLEKRLVIALDILDNEHD